MTMVAYFGERNLKAQFLRRVRHHRRMDQIAHGCGYWSDFCDGRGYGGCAVGCTVHSREHCQYETQLGIPADLARVEEALFEASHSRWTMDWPRDFLQAIPVGAELGGALEEFAKWATCRWVEAESNDRRPRGSSWLSDWLRVFFRMCPDRYETVTVYDASRKLLELLREAPVVTPPHVRKTRFQDAIAEQQAVAVG